MKLAKVARDLRADSRLGPRMRCTAFSDGMSMVAASNRVDLRAMRLF